MGKGGYGLTYQEVYEMENLTIEAKAIYGMLCSYAGSKAMAYPSVDFICDKLKISRTRFYKHMNLLVGAGVVKKEQRKNENQSFSGNVYVLVPNLQNIQISSRIMETSTVLAMPEFSVRKKKADERNEAFLRGILEE